MDPARFDTLIKTLSTTGTRRGLLHLLTALPVAGAIAALLGDGGAARGRREKRKDRHQQDQTHRQQRRRHEEQQRQKDKDQQKRAKQRKKPTPEPGCQPASKAQTCTGHCGSVTDNCGLLVDCGACDCDPLCGECLTCDPATGACIPDDTQEEDACGQPGQICQADGSCACTPGGTTCPTCHSCVGGVCSRLPNGTVCGTQSPQRHSASPGTIRCCDGDCPDPDCVPSGENQVSCDGGGDECAGVTCCSQDNRGCLTFNFCYCWPPSAGGPCGSDYDCGGQNAVAGAATACICGTCQEPPPP